MPGAHTAVMNWVFVSGNGSLPIPRQVIIEINATLYPYIVWYPETYLKYISKYKYCLSTTAFENFAYK